MDFQEIISNAVSDAKRGPKINAGFERWRAYRKS
jgi:hypothetical protein